uniref:RING-type domain-containing protein n=1 Tax=Anas platyrhynchos platyrhynchos TaxID=8840 RepID=A0A493TXM0_ANAPP
MGAAGSGGLRGCGFVGSGCCAVVGAAGSGCCRLRVLRGRGAYGVVVLWGRDADPPRSSPSPGVCVHSLHAPAAAPAGLAVLRPAAARAGPALRGPAAGSAPRQHPGGRLQQRGAALPAGLPPPRPLPAGCRRLPRAHAGHGGVPGAGAGGVPVGPAGRPPPLPRFLAGALLPAPLRLPRLLRQRRGPAGAALRPAQQRGRVLQHTLFPHGAHLHRLLPGPGRAQPLQVLPAGLRSLPQRQRHAPGGDGGGDAAAAGAADGAAGPAGPAADLPPQHHPLHRRHLHAAVHDRDRRPHRAGAGGFPKQEPLEAFSGCQHVPLPAGLPLLHGLQDRPLLPPGFLAAHPGLQLHAHLAAGAGHPVHLRAVRGGAAAGHAAGAHGRDHLRRHRRQPRAGVFGGPVRGGLRQLGVPGGRVELGGGLGHRPALLLQRLAARPGGLEEFPAAPPGCPKNQLPAPRHPRPAAGPRRRLRHLLPGEPPPGTLNGVRRSPPPRGCVPPGDVPPPVCPQDMQVAVVTPCGHFFHGACLRKWLYVQDTCPMCHQGVAPAAPQDDAGSGMGTQEGAAPEDEGLEDAGPPARPQEDEPPPGDSVPTGPGASRAGACSPERGE